jgi:hypothetical protein
MDIWKLFSKEKSKLWILYLVVWGLLAIAVFIYFKLEG